jgi:hypothetical protein
MKILKCPNGRGELSKNEELKQENKLKKKKDKNRRKKITSDSHCEVENIFIPSILTHTKERIYILSFSLSVFQSGTVLYRFW